MKAQIRITSKYDIIHADPFMISNHDDVSEILNKEFGYEITELFDEELNEDDYIDIKGMTFDASEVLSTCDPVAYAEERNFFLDRYTGRIMEFIENKETFDDGFLKVETLFLVED